MELWDVGDRELLKQGWRVGWLDLVLPQEMTLTV